MNMQVAIDGIEDRLRHLARAREVPAGVRDQAQRYLSRLISPVRTTVFGRPSEGKSRLISTAIGQRLLPPLPAPPTCELRYGDIPSIQLTRSDGSVAEIANPDDPTAYDGAILAAVERPIALLRNISFLDVQADDTPEDQRAAIAWAAPRTDIALWCSERFDDIDRALWETVPEQIKDHAYLILTGTSGDAADVIRAEAMDVFHDCYVVDLDAPAGQSGVSDLTDRLLEHARTGRQADADGALLFLRAQEAAQEQRAARPTTRPVTQVIADPDPEPNAASADDDQPAVAPHRPTTRTLEVPPARTGAGFEVYSAGLRFIRKQSATLLVRMRAGEEIDPGAFTTHCGGILLQLSNMLADQDEDAVPGIGAVMDTVFEAENIVTLLANEKGADRVLDAAAVLLQVRRDMEACLAA